MALATRSTRIRLVAAVVLYLIWVAALAALAVWSGARPPSASGTSAMADGPSAPEVAAYLSPTPGS